MTEYAGVDLSGPDRSLELRPETDGVVPCIDPECTDEEGRHSAAEPEQDGDLRFYACPECGSEFGWRRVASDPSCQLGVPERARTVGDAATAAAERKRAPGVVGLGTTIPVGKPE